MSPGFVLLPQFREVLENTPLLTPRTNEHGVLKTIKCVMSFDLLEHFFKMCEGGTVLGARYPTVTKRRVILAPSVGPSMLG